MNPSQREEHNMHIVLLGATGFVGSALLKEALHRGHKVTAVVRHPEKLASQEGLAAKAGDVYDPDRLAMLIRGHDALISAFNPGWQNPLAMRASTRAVKFVGVSHPAQITDVAKPAPGLGQVVIKIVGIGGLGHMAVQLVRILAPVRIIAADVDPAKLEQAKALGADDVISTQNVDAAAEQIRNITGPRGAGLVLECVGVQSTV
jgi:NADPH:quinone reductase-like Zn-dependent oxidoreductase